MIENVFDIDVYILVGLSDASKACCRTWADGTGCMPLAAPCTNRSKSVFWDNIHLTQTVYSIIASQCISNRSVCTPVTIEELVKI